MRQWTLRISSRQWGLLGCQGFWRLTNWRCCKTTPACKQVRHEELHEEGEFESGVCTDNFTRFDGGGLDWLAGTGVATTLRIVHRLKPFLTNLTQSWLGWLFLRKPFWTDESSVMTSRLADRPMRTLDEVTVEVSWCWKSITRKDTSDAFIEMKERMQEELSLKETLLAANLAVFCLINVWQKFCRLIHLEKGMFSYAVTVFLAVQDSSIK